MAFADNLPRTIVQGFLPCQVTLAGAVAVGDLITYNSGWKQAAANTATAVFVAGESGASGDEITAFAGAIIEGPTGGAAGGLIMAAANGGYNEAATGQRVGLTLAATRIYVGPTLLPVAVA
jgi:hypothetical protein